MDVPVLLLCQVATALQSGESRRSRASRHMSFKAVSASKAAGKLIESEMPCL